MSTAESGLLEQIITRSDRGGLLLALLDESERRLLRRCALVRRFERDLFDEVLRKDAHSASSSPAFERFVTNPGVRVVPGRPGWFRVLPEDREQIVSAWRAAAPPSEDPDVLSEEHFRELNRRLADWFQKHLPDAEFEVYYHLLVSNPDEAKDRIRHAYAEAVSSFDLARCESLLEILDQRSRFLDSDLAGYRATERGLLEAQSAFADDYYRTGRYLTRPSLMAAIDEVFQDPTRFILNLYGGGGSGKTMFLRWLGARHCWPLRIPIARVDFDFLLESDAGLAAPLLLGKLAARLDVQLPSRLFGSFLGDVEEMRRMAEQHAAGKKPSAFPVLRESERDELIERFANLLEEHCRGEVLFVFDTVEDAASLHHLDVPALVDCLVRLRDKVLERATLQGRAAPRIAVILSGRYSLQEQHGAAHANFAHRMVTRKIPAFDTDEARTYLTSLRRVPDSSLLNIAIERSRGMPIKLSLYADVLLTNPGLSERDLRCRADVDLLVLIERVLKRIREYPLRWTLRYGVAARRLTLGFLKNVLAPHLERALQGDRRYDDPALDYDGDPSWPRLWSGDEFQSRSGRLNYAQLWSRLRSFASSSSWVSVDSQESNTLVFQPVVTHPLRRVLRKQRVFQAIHRDAVLSLRKALRRRVNPDPEDLDALTYHEFQLDVPEAIAAWKRRLKQYSGNLAAQRALANTILAPDLAESEIEDSGTRRRKLIPTPVRAQAEFVLAECALQVWRSEGSASEIGQARIHFANYDSLRTKLRERVTSAVSEGLLRRQLANTQAEIDSATDLLLRSAERNVAPEERAPLFAALRDAFRFVDPDLSRRYGSRVAEVALRRDDAAAFLEAVLDSIHDMVRAGSVAAALQRCESARRSLLARAASWRSRKSARQSALRLRIEQAGLESECGLSAAALTRFPKLPQWVTPLRSLRTRALAMQIHLEVQNARYSNVERAASYAIKLLEQRSRLKSTPDSLIRTRRRISEVRYSRAQALRRGMRFAECLDEVQGALAEAATRGDSLVAHSLRLFLARIYLYDIEDLNQAEQQLILRGEQPLLPEQQIEQAMLRAGVGDRRGQSEAVRNCMEQARRLVGQADPPLSALAQVEFFVTALSLEHWSDRRQLVAELRDALKVIDHPNARCARLAGLEYCAPVADVGDGIRKDLLQLTRPTTVAGAEHGRITPADKLRLNLIRVELMRVLGESDQAAALLQRQKSALKHHLPAFSYRQVALACDRLGVAPDDLLPSSWRVRIRDELLHCPILLAALDLDLAARQLKGGKLDEAATNVAVIHSLLKEVGVTGYAIFARCLELSAAIASGQGDTGTARRFHSEAQDLQGRLGHLRISDSDPRAEYEARQIRAAGEGAIVLEIDSDGELTRALWTRADGARGRTRPLPPTPVLAQALQDLKEGVLVAGGMRALIRLLSSGWQQIGGELASSFFPAAELQGQLALESSPTDVIVASPPGPFHAVPWELLYVGADQPRPVSLQPGIRHFWRFSPVEHPGIKTGSPWGFVDFRVTQLGRAAKPQGRPALLLIGPGEPYRIGAAQSSARTGYDIVNGYESAGVEVKWLQEPDLKLLRKFLRQHEFDFVHIVAAIGGSASIGDVFLQFGRQAALDSATITPFSASLIAHALSETGAHGKRPAVILDVPRPPSLEEALRQMMWRNVFASKLSAFAGGTTVLATGLGSMEQQALVADVLVDGVAKRVSLLNIADDLRKLWPRMTTRAFRNSEANATPELPTLCTVLYMASPDFDRATGVA